MLKIRFKHLPKDNIWNCFCELITLATGEQIKIVESQEEYVDIEITGPYGDIFNQTKTPFVKRAKRFIHVKFTHGQHLLKRDLSVGDVPANKSKLNFWFTGENTRPPQGNWDLYFGFDTNLSTDRSIYFPLWWLTSSSLFSSVKKSYWGIDVPDIYDLTQSRKLNDVRSKFATTFIGKTYPIRLHALEELNKIDSVDIYGSAVRNFVDQPFEIASLYKFILCFENDVYPGYVTEKPFEAYMSGSIPLYYGLDSAGYLNQEAIINLYNFENIKEWRIFISEVHNDPKLYKEIYEKPLLNKIPDIESILIKLRKMIVN